MLIGSTEKHTMSQEPEEHGQADGEAAHAEDDKDHKRNSWVSA
jgi:hypothetical protein